MSLFGSTQDDIDEVYWRGVHDSATAGFWGSLMTAAAGAAASWVPGSDTYEAYQEGWMDADKHCCCCCGCCRE